MCLAMNADKLEPGERCASTSNRNFEGRQGRGGRTHLLSPAMAAAATRMIHACGKVDILPRIAASEGAAEAGIEALTLTPRLADFNDDLRRYGLVALQSRLRLHLHSEDAARFVPV